MRRFPSQLTQPVAVYHLATEKQPDGQPYPETPDARIDLALIPMDRKSHALEGLVLTNPFEIYAEATDDVRVGDKLIVADGVYAGTYYCKKTFVVAFGGLPHNRCSVSTEI